MRKLFFLPLLFSLFLFSCDDPKNNPSAGDSTYHGDSTKGISVSNPLDHAPHTVKDSIYNGQHVERYDNGVIYMRGDVAGGLRVGEWLTFYKSGKPWSQGIYEAGLRQGYGVSWWENGQKSSEGYYKEDKMVGKWKFWDAYGNMKEKDFGGSK